MYVGYTNPDYHYFTAKKVKLFAAIWWLLSQ